jgi:hypothetical protein
VAVKITVARERIPLRFAIDEIHCVASICRRFTR